MLATSLSRHRLWRPPSNLFRDGRDEIAPSWAPPKRPRSRIWDAARSARSLLFTGFGGGCCCGGGPGPGVPCASGGCALPTTVTATLVCNTGSFSGTGAPSDIHFPTLPLEFACGATEPGDFYGSDVILQIFCNDGALGVLFTSGAGGCQLPCVFGCEPLSTPSTFQCDPFMIECTDFTLCEMAFFFAGCPGCIQSLTVVA
jgi:hypothetical protein